MANLFTSALSGMNAAQIGMATTEHNIANASTPGYSRQEVMVSSRAGERTGAGFVGQGVDATGVKRIYDEFLTSQVRLEQTQASYLATYHTAIQQIDNLLADPTAGPSPAIQGFFDAMNGVANNPESLPARQTLLSNAQFAVNRFQAIDQRLSDIANGVTAQISTSVSTVNSYAQQISTLNASIKRATANGQGQLPNDLLDQRDHLINQLNQEVKVSFQQQSDGTVSVYVGSGQALVVGEQVMQLQMVQSQSDSNKVEVAYLADNKIIYLDQNSLQGGKIGAYIGFRDQSLEPSRNALGRVALGMSDSINRQNQMGQDLNGALGGNLFKVASPRVDKNANNNPASGLPFVTIDSVAGLTTSDYQLKFNAGGSYTLLRMSDNVSTNYASLPQTVDGMTISAPTSVVAGDSFLIRPTANGARDISLLTTDPSRIAAAGPIRGAASSANIGTAKISNGTVNAPLPINSNLRNNVTVSFVDATHFSVTDNSTLPAPTVLEPGMLYDPNAGATLSFNGWTTQISGKPVAGDTFNITPNTNASGDSRNALLMTSIQSQNMMLNGTVNLQGAFSLLVGEVGNKTSEMSVMSMAQDSMVAQTVASQQSVSGVNLDEEAANLIRYQKAYQAAAKAMQIAQTMFDALMSIK